MCSTKFSARGNRVNRFSRSRLKRPDLAGVVGGGGLGYYVVAGFSQFQLFGKGLAAGIAITALGVMLDRITVNTAARYGRAETA